MHTVSTNNARTAATSPVRPPKLTAAQRKQQQKLADERQGRQDAAEWAEAQHPEEVRDIARMGRLGSKSNPWYAFPGFHALNSKLKAGGREYATAFLDEVDAYWQWIGPAWRYAAYAEGVADGRRWAASLATPDQLDRLRSALRNSGRRVLIDTEERYEDLPAAHGLLTWILGQDVYEPRVTFDVDGDKEYEYDSDSQAFKSFWQPFFAEPIDEVLESVDVEGTNAKCKLIEPDYIHGFIDGATGLSDRLRADHLA